jgi:hypothetical protein
MHNNKLTTVKLIGTLLIIIGSIQLIMSAESIWWFIAILFHPGSYNSYLEYLFDSAISLLFTSLPLAAIIAGYGLLKNNTWSWQLAVVTCLCMFILNLLGVIKFAVLCYQWSITPVPPIPPISEGKYYVESGYFSMWPTYIYTVVSALLIIMLNRKSVKNKLNNPK